jgi:hypothetical protein
MPALRAKRRVAGDAIAASVCDAHGEVVHLLHKQGERRTHRGRRTKVSSGGAVTRRAVCFSLPSPLIYINEFNVRVLHHANQTVWLS